MLTYSQFGASASILRTNRYYKKFEIAIVRVKKKVTFFSAGYNFVIKNTPGLVFILDCIKNR